MEKDLKFSSRKYFFLLQRYAMNVVGYWPQQENVKVSRIVLALLNAHFLFYICAVEFNYAYIHSDKLSEVLDCLTPISTILVTSIKLLVMTFHHKKIKIILDKLLVLFTEDKDNESLVIHSRMSKYSYMFTLFIGTFGHVTGFFYCSLPVFKNLYLYFNDKPLVPDLPFKSNFWVDTSQFSNYLPAYLALAYSSIVVVFGFAANDGLFVGICLHLTAQFEIMEVKINNLLEKAVGKGQESKQEFTALENDKIYEEFKVLVEKHNYIIDLCSDMSSTLTINVLGHYVSAAFVLCFSLLSLLLAEGADKLIYINYTMAATSQVMAYSIGGTMLSNSSLNIKFAAYNFPWYKCNFKIRKALLMIIQRADREVGVNVPFFKSNIETFGTIAKTSLSYIALFKTFL